MPNCPDREMVEQIIALRNIWRKMIGRCYCKTDTAYKDYGGRGIRVAKEWKDDFYAFVRDVYPRPEGTSLDRIDNDGDYSKENCWWATRIEQANNMRSNRHLIYKGEKHTIAEWSEITGINRNTLFYRLNRGKTIEEILTPPIRKPELYTIKGEAKTAYGWSKHYGIPYKIVSDRLIRGKTIEEALTVPKRVYETYTIKGETKTRPQWAEHYGIPYNTVKNRMSRRGKTIEEALGLYA